MKNILSFLYAILVFSIGYAQDFTVNKYEVDIYIQQEGYFDVVENYDLTFERYKHGIYRTIQTNYDLANTDGTREKRKIKISNIKVPGHKFESPFDFEQKLSDKINIKIGDKDKTIIGPQHYEIKYRVHNAFLFEESQISFYWNIKPDGWNANFYKINFRVHAPDDIILSKDNCFVYSGYRGASALSNDFNLTFNNTILTGTSFDDFVSRPNENVTLLIKLPVNSINEVKPFWPFWVDYGWTFIIVGLITAFYIVWNKFGKDEHVVSTTSYYAPENIDPALAGFLINDSDDSSDLIALLPYWGSKGYIKIEEIPKKGLFGKSDTKLIKVKSLPTDAPDYELEIFNGLFDDSTSSPNIGESILLSKKGKTLHVLNKIYGGEQTEIKPGEVLASSLENSFYTTMNSAKSLLKKQAQPYYEAKSRKVKGITLGLLITLGILLSAVGLFVWGIIAAAAIVITCVILIFLNTYMIKKNAKGNRIFSELKGFKRFIKVAEENKLKMLLQDDPSYFENTMGYALAFGLFEKWSKKFDALNIPPPDWYSSTTVHHLSMHNFSKSFSSAMTSVKSTMVSTPSSSGSSGGGSSGGGFGGGGGGSW